MILATRAAAENLDAATHADVVGDLHRHGCAYYGFPVIAEAGVETRVYRAFPFRLCVERPR